MKRAAIKEGRREPGLTRWCRTYRHTLVSSRTALAHVVSSRREALGGIRYAREVCRGVGGRRVEIGSVLPSTSLRQALRDRNGLKRARGLL